MPFFNFRRNGSSPPINAASAPQHESVEVIRKRAKHRLIGAVVLVLAGVVGFPLLFDTQPRPIAMDIPIEIPAKNSVKPLVIPAKQVASSPVPMLEAGLASAAGAPVASVDSNKVAVASVIKANTEVLVDKKLIVTAVVAPVAIKKEAKSDSKSDAKSDAKLEVKPDVKLAPKLDASVNDGARAAALLNGNTVKLVAASDAISNRMVVQVGAFADVVKAREVRLKLEKAGFKTYTQVAETKDGKRIRVRVGPFASRPEADKAASKIKTLDLPAAVLTL